jgi:type IV secretory pathway protease TraF
MSTPLHDLIKAQFDDVAELAHRRGYLEAQLEILKMIRSIKKPTSQIKELMKRIENGNNGN